MMEDEEEERENPVEPKGMRSAWISRLLVGMEYGVRSPRTRYWDWGPHPGL